MPEETSAFSGYSTSPMPLWEDPPVNWVDRWARRAAARDVAEPATSGLPGSAPSRRDFLKRAAVVGSAVWTVPVLQTVMAPAASASPGTPLGDPCNDLGPCAGGAYCNGTRCGGVGAICPGSVCASGIPCSGRTEGAQTCGGPGATCSGSEACDNGNCASGVCGGQWAWCGGGGGNAVCAPGKTCSFFGLLCLG